MNRIGPYRYVQDDDVERVELPYEGDELSMVVILPGSGRFDEIVTSLDEPTLSSYLASLQSTHLDLSLSRFDFGSRSELKEPLIASTIPPAEGGRKRLRIPPLRTERVPGGMTLACGRINPGEVLLRDDSGQLARHVW